MSVGRRVIDHFVLPAGERSAPHRPAGAARRRNQRAGADTPGGAPPSRACAVPLPRTPASLAVLAPAAEAHPLAAALGLALARRDRAPAAVVCVWSPPAPAPRRAPALPGAARLAAALAARGHDARASGRLVVVRLVADPPAAAAEARRALAAAAPAPAVLALGGPRAAAFDALLAEQDLVVVAVAAGADPALARLALAGLERGLACEIPPARPGRALAVAGVALPPSMRRALAAPVAALS